MFSSLRLIRRESEILNSESMQFNIRALLRQYRRVLFITRKPSKDEFTGAGKICLIGIFLIGLIGFGIFIAFTLLMPGL